MVKERPDNVLPALTEVTWEGPLVAVAELDVDLQSCQSSTGHVTQGALDMVHLGVKKRKEKGVTRVTFCTEYMAYYITAIN